MSERFSPSGKRIKGTLETIEGTALISDFNEDGTFEYSGTTDVWWDSQKTQKNAQGERLYVDEDGGIWPESKLRKTPPKRRKSWEPVSCTEAGTRVISSNGKTRGRLTGANRLCSLEGCGGERLTTRWDDGKISHPCTKGMTLNKSKKGTFSWRIG